MAAAATALNLPRLLKGIPKGAWVAISSRTEEVLNYGSDMRTVLAEAKKKGDQHPIITRVPEGPATLLL
jgi:hypothetical protein